MREPKTYEFVNRHGQKVHLPGDMTLEQMIAACYTDFTFKKPGEPLAAGEWRCEQEGGKNERE
jgi:hypothetical protein